MHRGYICLLIENSIILKSVFSPCPSGTHSHWATPTLLLFCLLVHYCSYPYKSQYHDDMTTHIFHIMLLLEIENTSNVMWSNKIIDTPSHSDEKTCRHSNNFYRTKYIQSFGSIGSTFIMFQFNSLYQIEYWLLWSVYFYINYSLILKNFDQKLLAINSIFLHSFSSFYNKIDNITRNKLQKTN